MRVALRALAMSPSTLAHSPESFHHEAFFYADEGDFLEGTSAFIRDGVRAQEPILVVVSARKIDLLRQHLQSDASRVQFADMDGVGLNPARIIPAWADFVLEHGERPVRGIGEPIWAERSPAELVECQRHEALLNVAFAGSEGFNLMCPYDTTALGPDVLDEARHSHPFLFRDGARWESSEYRGVAEMAGPFTAPLPEPPRTSVDLEFQAGSLRGLRDQVVREASRAGISDTKVRDMVTAVNEVASNSLRHAGGRGVLRVWQAGDDFICEVSDDGRIDEPLVGRRRPEVGAATGRGLWMVNQLCELVQVRSTTSGTTVRMHFRRQEPS
jgi:anti-sigma regulatory factor (Ser/Thr protein kinase)